MLRPNAVNGHGAWATFVRAGRKVFKHNRDYVGDINPFAEIQVSKQALTDRVGLAGGELQALFDAAWMYHDAELGLSVMTFLRETASRRMGALNLTIKDMYERKGEVRILGKGGRHYTVPISRFLIEHLADHAMTRGATKDTDLVFRRASGKPLTGKSYIDMFTHIRALAGDSLPQGFSSHWIRYTTISDYAEIGELVVGAAVAGHLPKSVTEQYSRPKPARMHAVHDFLFPDLISRDVTDRDHELEYLRVVRRNSGQFTG